MKIKEIKYQRVRNLGNFETERVELVADIDPEENVKLIYGQLRLLCEMLLLTKTNRWEEK